MKHSIYLISRYGRIEEMQAIAADLTELGHDVCSSWVKGEHKALDNKATFEQLQRWCNIDIKDLEQASLIIAFTEQPGNSHARGGRHVEYGYALAFAQNAPHHVWLHVVGHRENMHYCAPEIVFWNTWEALRAHLIMTSSIRKADVSSTTEGQNRDILDVKRKDDI